MVTREELGCLLPFAKRADSSTCALSMPSFLFGIRLICVPYFSQSLPLPLRVGRGEGLAAQPTTLIPLPQRSGLWRDKRAVPWFLSLGPHPALSQRERGPCAKFWRTDRDQICTVPYSCDIVRKSWRTASIFGSRSYCINFEPVALMDLP